MIVVLLFFFSLDGGEEKYVRESERVSRRVGEVWGGEGDGGTAGTSSSKKSKNFRARLSKQTRRGEAVDFRDKIPACLFAVAALKCA